MKLFNKSNENFSLQIHSSIKSKLFILSVLLLTIPMLVLGVFSYIQSSKSLDELGEVNLKNSVEMTIEMIEVLNKEVEEENITIEEAQEKVKTAILGEKQEDGTREINKNINMGKYGYLFVLDQKGNEIASPFAEGQNTWDAEDEDGVKYIQEMIAAGNEGGGFTYYNYPLTGDESVTERKVAYSETDPHWGWVINAGTYMSDFNQSANSLVLLLAITTIATLIIGIIIINIFSNRITKPIRQVTEHMGRLAEGDLTMEPLDIHSKDETGLLAQGANHLQNTLRDMISKVTNSSGRISSHSEELTQSANEVKSGSEQVAMTMEELASGAEKQASNATDLSTMMADFADKLQKIDEQILDINNNSTSVIALTDEGSRLMESSNRQMTKIEGIVHDAVQKVHNLDKEAQEISKLIDVIKDIADQTNLLALNAAIEAARAGEQGKGFAVVADEVRKLAEQVSMSVKDITGIVTNIQKDSKTVTDSLNSGYQEVEAGTNQINTTNQTFSKISRAINDVAAHIESMAINITQITAQSYVMSDNVQDIAAIAEESAAGIEQTSASTQQTTSSMQEVAASSEELAKLAEELIGSISQFNY